MKQKTSWIKKEDINREWYVVDVSDQVLGRAASKIATLLTGKRKVNKVPNFDAGDYVIVVNSDKVKISGNKAKQKEYFRHSGYPGGAKTITFEKQMKKDSTFVIREAVKNMIPKNKLQSERLNRLFIYSGDAHKQGGQKPKEYKL